MRTLVLAIAVAWALSEAAAAQIPPEIASYIRDKGQVMDFATMQLYAPLHDKEPYPGAEVVRDLAYGSDPLQKLDVFSPPGAAGATRPIVLFVHGGGFVRGDKHGTPGSPFEDNHPLWAARNDMVGVNINYRLAPKNPWPAAAEDLAAAIRWTKANAARFGGDANRIFIWGHSAGANHVADYVAHPQFHVAPGGGVAGAFIQSANYGPLAEPSPYYGTDTSLSGLEASVDRMSKSTIPMFLAYAEFDPPMFHTYMKALHAGLEKAGRRPTMVYLKGHNHFSEGASVGTDDKLLTGPMLEFIRKTR